jgi:hypothetical protein
MALLVIVEEKGPDHMTDERAADDGQPGEHLFDEKNRIEGLNRIRQLVFGSLDGLLVPLSVVSAVAEAQAVPPQ